MVKSKGGRPAIGDAPMTASERARRSQKRQAIMRKTAKEHGLEPATFYLPERMLEHVGKLQREDAQGSYSVDQIIFEALYGWLAQQPEAVKEKLGFDPKEDAFNAIEQAIHLAAKKIDEEGL